METNFYKVSDAEYGLSKFVFASSEKEAKEKFVEYFRAKGVYVRIADCFIDM